MICCSRVLSCDLVRRYRTSRNNASESHHHPPPALSSVSSSSLMPHQTSNVVSPIDRSIDRSSHATAAGTGERSWGGGAAGRGDQNGRRQSGRLRDRVSRREATRCRRAARDPLRRTRNSRKETVPSAFQSSSRKRASGRSTTVRAGFGARVVTHRAPSARRARRQPPECARDGRSPRRHYTSRVRRARTCERERTIFVRASDRASATPSVRRHWRVDPECPPPQPADGRLSRSDKRRRAR